MGENFYIILKVLLHAIGAYSRGNLKLLLNFENIGANSNLTHNRYTFDLYFTQRHSYYTNFCDTIFTRILIINITSPHSHNGTPFDHAVYHALLLYIMFLKLPPTL